MVEFITDENIAKSVVKGLRKEGFNVKDIKEEKLYGMSDKTIIEMAIKENRVIITHDKNFGNVLNNPNVDHRGIIFIRFKVQNPENVGSVLSKALKSEFLNKFENSLIVISENQINIINNKSI